METHYNQMPRRSGKTTKAIELYKQSPDDSLIVTNRQEDAKYLKRLSNDPKIKTCSHRQFARYCEGREIKNVIADEVGVYDKYRDFMQEVRDFAPHCGIEHLHIFTT